MEDRFPVSSDDCRLLLLLESMGSVRDAASVLRRDVSVVSRQLAALGESSAVVEKVGGRWRVSPLGRRVAAWARDAIAAQRQALRSQHGLKIATTREFAALVLAPRIAELADDPSVQLTVIASERGAERLLLSGEADVGLDCGRPSDPGVRFRRVVPEPFAIVASRRLLGRRRPARLDGLLALPHLAFTRFSAARALGLGTDSLRTRAFFNDIASVRAACVAGAGWAVLPRYSAGRELASGELVELRGAGFPVPEPEQFGVWWLRERKALEPWVERLTAWLRGQRLG